MASLRELITSPALPHVHNGPSSSGRCHYRNVAAWGGGVLLTTRDSVWCLRALAYQRKYSQPIAAPPSGKRVILNRLWRDFFSDPSQWWDNRSEKVNAKYPDFKHKTTEDALWLDNRLNPAWVSAELAAMAPGAVQADVFAWNQKLARCVKAGRHKRAIEIFQQMQQDDINPNNFSFVPVLNACASLRALQEGKRIHSLILQAGCESDIYVGSCLVGMYAKCGSIEDARTVFDKMPTHDVVSWSTMLRGYVSCGEAQKALDLFQAMLLQEGALHLDPLTYVGLLTACADLFALEEGRRVHEQIIESGCESNVLVGNSLVDMYAKCGTVDDAWRVFKKMPARNVVAWSTMILGFVNVGLGQRALELYQEMQRDGVNPDPKTYVALLNACASVGSLEEGAWVHEQTILSGCESNVLVGNGLIDMYAKCGSIEDAWRVFRKIRMRDVMSWNAMIHGYVSCGHGQKALDLWHQMQRHGVHPNPTTFVGVLNACASMAALDEGRRAHEQIIERGYGSDVYVTDSLIDMYTKCGSIEDAQRMFQKTELP